MSGQPEEKSQVNVMRLLLRSLGFAKPFAALYALSILLNSIYSALGAIAIAIIKPTMEILFSGTITKGLPVKNNATVFENLKDNFFSWVSGVILNPQSTFNTLLNLSLLIISIFLLKNLFKYYGSVVNSRLEEGIMKHMRDFLFRKFTSLSVDFFSSRKSGKLMTILMSDIGIVKETNISTAVGMLRDIVQIIIFLTLLLAISEYLTLLAFSTSIVSFITLRFAMKYLRRYATRMQNAISEYTAALQETLMGIRVVKAYNAEVSANSRFSAQTANYVKASVKYTKVGAVIPSLNEIFAIVAMCFVFFAGGNEVLKGTMRADDLMLFLFSLFSVMGPIAAIVNNVAQFSRGAISAGRLFDVIDQKPTVEAGADTITDFNSEIRVSNVSFAYEDNPVIKNASFKIHKKKKVAFVGSSGSGKSTMLDLLIRFYDPLEGNITIDEVPVKNLKTESYRSLFGIVSQETMLFNDTIANNIRFGMDDIPLERVHEAAKIANAYDFITKMPSGFDTMIGERGMMISGGERQRIAIARALVRQPKILIFDEATSSLDAESEKIVQQAINESLVDRTAIIVAHRLSTIINCDEILVFDDGIIVERGTHTELFAQNGIYRKLYEIQYARQLLGKDYE